MNIIVITKRWVSCPLYPLQATPLFLACYVGNSEAALLLLSKGADPNKAAKDDYGDVTTPLFVAAQEGYSEVVRSLLESKADPNKGYRSTDSDGEVHVTTPLYAAAEQESTEVVRILLASGARQDLDTGGGELGWSYIIIIIANHQHIYINIAQIPEQSR